MFYSLGSWFFFFFVIMGILVRVSSDSWFGVWCGLELNIISFIPLVYESDNKYRSEAILKYFLVQVIGSSFLLLGVIREIISLRWSVMMCMALLLKLGRAPIHFWLPQVIEGLLWAHVMVLVTVQKFAPIFLLSYLIGDSLNDIVIRLRAILSSIIGAIGGVNQILLRKMIAFSSINHISWIMFGIIISEGTWIIYFIFYSVITLRVIIIFNSRQCYHFLQLVRFKGDLWNLVGIIRVLSLGGLPPFTGFIPKWLLIQDIVSVGIIFPFIILLPITLVTLYYYLRIVILFMIISYPRMRWRCGVSYSYKWNYMLIGVNFLGITIPSFFILI